MLTIKYRVGTVQAAEIGHALETIIESAHGKLYDGSMVQSYGMTLEEAEHLHFKWRSGTVTLTPKEARCIVGEAKNRQDIAESNDNFALARSMMRLAQGLEERLR